MIGYTNYDHAGWVESNIAAFKRTAAGQTAAREAAVAAGAKRIPRAPKPPKLGWGAAPDKLNRFQQQAMMIIGMSFGGIYNAPLAWDGIDWSHPRTFSVAVRGGVSTFDNAMLTAFVFLCHEARIRGTIGPCGPRHIRLTLHPREAEGGTYQRHPGIGEAVSTFKAALHRNHPVTFDYTPPADPCERCGIDLAGTGNCAVPDGGPCLGDEGELARHIADRAQREGKPA